ncbi:dihydroorotate dehydrogenase [Candidatus Woesearchaeota archaeon]|nr:dihydroorotate dehydrogenase [Candidatus Woesearchaeota archaeon]
MATVDISTKILNVKLTNPTILASGIVGISGAACCYAAKNGAGAIIPKSIGPREREGHNNPILVEFKGGFLNAVGLPNAGIDNSLGEIEFAMKNAGVPVIPSIFGGTKEEFGMVAEKMATLKPQLIEVNLSCPNTGSDFGEAFALNAKEAADVIRIVKSKTKVPIIAKLAPNVPSIKKIAKAVEEAGADAISAINTMPGMVIDVKTAKPVLHNKQGGVSGHAIKPIAVNCIYDIYEAVKIPIIGMGGVTTGEDAVEMIMAGAVAVEIGTAIYYRGIDVFRKVSDEIKQFMEENSYGRISDMIGIAHK